MGRKKFCYWSVADGQHALMMQTCVRSARAARVREDFHVWSDRAIRLYDTRRPYSALGHQFPAVVHASLHPPAPPCGLPGDRAPTRMT